MAYDRLTAADAAFLHMESPHQPQHVGSLSVIEGGPLRDDAGRIRFEEIKARIESRLDRVPRLRQRVMRTPLDQGHPIWVDDDHFDIDYHIRLAALPRPGDDAQLATLMGRIQSTQLDLRRPLWEIWLVDGMAGGDVAMILKTHHSMGDGIATVDLALALIDLEPIPLGEEPPQPLDAGTTRPRRPAPTPGQLFVDSFAEQLSRPLTLARRAYDALLDPTPLLQGARNLWTAASTLSGAAEPAPWNARISPHRRWAHADVALGALHPHRKAHGATINDLVLTACSGALHGFLRQVDPDRADRALTAVVPVSRRAEHERGTTLGNRVSMAVIELPIHETDPLTRLRLLHERGRAAKTSGAIEGAESLLHLAEGFPAIAPLFTRHVFAPLLARRVAMNLIITNVPGPPVPIYMAGGRIRRCYPYVEILDNEGLTIAVVSYDDHLHFGVTGDRDLVPELELLTEGIEKHFNELAAVMSAANTGISDAKGAR